MLPVMLCIGIVFQVTDVKNYTFNYDGVILICKLTLLLGELPLHEDSLVPQK